MVQQLHVLIRWTLLAAVSGLASGVCHAAPEEIQVYLDEFAEPGRFGLDLHTNAVLSARRVRPHSVASPHTTSNFLVFDFSLAGWDFDLGVGRSYGSSFANSDRMVVKLILGVPI